MSICIYMYIRSPWLRMAVARVKRHYSTFWLTVTEATLMSRDRCASTVASSVKGCPACRATSNKKIYSLGLWQSGNISGSRSVCTYSAAGYTQHPENKGCGGARVAAYFRGGLYVFGQFALTEITHRDMKAQDNHTSSHYEMFEIIVLSNHCSYIDTDQYITGTALLSVYIQLVSYRSILCSSPL